MRSEIETTNGVSRSVPDPRRRFGGHEQARHLLAEDGRSLEVVSRAWRGLASALRWHTLQAGLAALQEEERQVLTLAYLEGHTNQEIASMLSVSVSTVRRRLSSALERLERHLRGTGAWISAVALLGLAAAMRFVSTSRLGKSLGTDGAHGAMLLTATGAAGAIVVGLLVISAAPPAQRSSTRPSVTAMLPLAHVPDALSIPAAAVPGIVDQRVSNSPAHTASIDVVRSDEGANAAQPGCHGNPTDAPPSTPVARPGSHPSGAPVTHPTAGGCGPHSQ